MELFKYWAIIFIIVLLNLFIGGLSSAFWLFLISGLTILISKVCFAAKHSIIKVFLDSALSPWVEKTLTERKIIKLFKRKERDENYFCFVCQERQCFKHDQSVKIDLFPQRKILIDSRLNELIEKCINLCLQNISSLNSNPSLCQEVRHAISFMVGNIMLKTSQHLNLTQFISCRLITVLTQHLNLFIEGKRNAKSAYFIPDQVLEEYKREGFYCDVDYLHKLVKSCHHLLLSPKITSNSTIQLFSLEILVNSILEPFVDLLSHPYYFNTFFILLFDGLSTDISDDPQYDNPTDPSHHSTKGTTNQDYFQSKDSNLEHLLDKFSDPAESSSENSLGLSLKEIIEDEQALFIFMQFLKEEGVVNLIQFILSLDAFNAKLLRPDLSDEEKVDLAGELELILKEFFDEHSSDYIYFKDQSIKRSLETVIAKKDIVLLQTEDPLYRAYDIVYNTIDKKFLPLFVRSSFFFKLIVGSRQAQSPSCEGYDDDNISVSSQVSSINGHCKKSSTYDDVRETSLKEEDSKNEKDAQIVHDLSSWKVSIDRVEKSCRSNGAGSFEYEDTFEDVDKLVYLIQVCDIKSDQTWEVQRGFDEFHVLQSKLRQFHGNIKGIDFQLPKRRLQLFSTTSPYSCTSSNVSFLQSRKQELQKFLQTLLSNPALQSSSLMHSFLNPDSSSSNFNSNNMDFKKMIKNLNSSLMLKSSSDLKAALLPFIMNLINSTLSKQSNETEDDEVEGSQSALEHFSKECYSQGPDLSSSYTQKHYTSPSPTRDMSEKCSDVSKDWDKGNSLYSLILFVLRNIYDLDERCSKSFYLFKLCKPILDDTFQLFLYLVINRKLREVMSLENFIYSLDALRSSLQSKNSPNKSTKEEDKLVKAREARAFKVLQDYFQSYLPLPITSSLSFHLYYCFQFKVINKQFIYMLLNQLFQVLFPEIFDLGPAESSKSK